MLGNRAQTSYSLQMETVKLWICFEPHEPKEYFYTSFFKKKSNICRENLFVWCRITLGASKEDRASCSDSPLGGCTGACMQLSTIRGMTCCHGASCIDVTVGKSTGAQAVMSKGKESKIYMSQGRHAAGGAYSCADNSSHPVHLDSPCSCHTPSVTGYSAPCSGTATRDT